MKNRCFFKLIYEMIVKKEDVVVDKVIEDVKEPEEVLEIENEINALLSELESSPDEK